MDARDKELLLRQLEGYRWLEGERIEKLRRQSVGDRWQETVTIQQWASRYDLKKVRPPFDMDLNSRWNAIREGLSRRAA